MSNELKYDAAIKAIGELLNNNREIKINLKKLRTMVEQAENQSKK